jgi:hypothetical protein
LVVSHAQARRRKAIEGFKAGDTIMLNTEIDELLSDPLETDFRDASIDLLRDFLWSNVSTADLRLLLNIVRQADDKD